MAREILICEQNISGETLSAWRDGVLPPAEMERIRMHAGGCAACQARLADFDEVARALLRQRELEPAGRILAGVRLRAGQRPRRAWGGLPRRRAWSGLGALGAVAAVLLLFVYVLGFGPGRPGTSSGGKTPTALQSATATLIPTLTATLVPAVRLSPVVDVSTAWGSHAAAATVEAGDSSHVMGIVGGITPDGRYLLGEEFTLTSNGSIDDNVPAQAGFMAVATKQFTPIGISDPAEIPPRCCLTDGRFLVAIHDTQPGATCGICHSEYWSYDLTTGQIYRIARGTDYGLIQNYFLSHGLFIMETGQGIMVANLATRTVAPLAGIPSMGISVFTWPYVLYSVAQGNSAAAHMRARDLATGQDVALPEVDALFTSPAGSSGGFAITGDTLFVTVVPPTPPGGSSSIPSALYQIDIFMRSDAQAEPIATYKGDLGWLAGANSRVVLSGGGVWDRAEKRFVTLNGSVLTLSGDYLATYVQGDSPTRAVGPTVTIYDTATLPVRTGG